MDKLPQWIGVKSLPAWLPKRVKDYIIMAASCLKDPKPFWQNFGKEPHDQFLPIEYYEAKMADEFLNTMPAYTDPQMEEVWKKLSLISDSAVFSFMHCINRYANQFEVLQVNKEGASQYLKALNKILPAIHKIQSILSDFEHYKYYQVPELSKTTKKLKKLVDSDIETARTYIKNGIGWEDYGNLTRKFQNEDAIRIYLIRRLHCVIKEHTNRPYHEYVATTVNVIFQSSYTGNDIAKIVKK